MSSWLSSHDPVLPLPKTHIILIVSHIMCLGNIIIVQLLISLWEPFVKEQRCSALNQKTLAYTSLLSFHWHSITLHRSGSLFNTGFLRRMLFEAVQHGLDEIQPLVKTLICEAECTTLKQFSIHGPASQNKQGEIKWQVAYKNSWVCGIFKCLKPIGNFLSNSNCSGAC